MGSQHACLCKCGSENRGGALPRELSEHHFIPYPQASIRFESGQRLKEVVPAGERHKELVDDWLEQTMCQVMKNPGSKPSIEFPEETMFPIFRPSRASTVSSELEMSFEDSTFTRRTSCESDCSSDISTPRVNKRRERKRLLITHTMGSCVSEALKLVIENSEDIHKLYTMDESNLGEGSFGIVKRAVLKSSSAVRAVKIISKDAMQEQIHLLKKEIKIMKMVDHPCLVMLYEIFEDSHQLYLVMQMCEGGHLLGVVKRIGKLTELQAGVVMHQVLRAVRYLHEHRICHRDLKSENCLLDSSGAIVTSNVKVADLGLSRTLKEGESFLGAAGTVTHMAPEMFNKKYGTPCDLFSCGVMAYFLLSARLPFAGDTHEAIKSRILSSRASFGTPEWVDITQPAMDFIGGLLKKNPKKRYTAKQALAHEWMERTAPKFVQTRLPKATLGKVLRFRKFSKLQRAVLHVMTTMLPDTETKAAGQFFMTIDVNGDGMISMDELKQGLGFETLKNGSGDEEDDLTYTEFLAATVIVGRHVKALFRATFNTFDKNGDGSLSISEVASGKLLGVLSVEDVMEEMEKIDLDGDGTLDIDEFKVMMLSILPDKRKVPKKEEKRVPTPSPRLSQKDEKRSRTPSPRVSQKKAPKKGEKLSPRSTQIILAH